MAFTPPVVGRVFLNLSDIVVVQQESNSYTKQDTGEVVTNENIVVVVACKEWDKTRKAMVSFSRKFRLSDEDATELLDSIHKLK